MARLTAEFVIEDGANGARVLRMQLLTNPADPRPILEHCHAMGPKILAEAVANTTMLAKVRTHPDDTEDPQKDGTPT